MADSLDQIFSECKKLLNRERDRRLISLFETGSESPRVAVERILREYAHEPICLGSAIHALSTSDFGPLARSAISALRKDQKNVAAHEFIAHASLQSLHSLRPHLRELFDLQPNWTTYYAMWPWRETGSSQFEFLAERAGKGKTFWRGGQSGLRWRHFLRQGNNFRSSFCRCAYPMISSI
jgi:hypothetical protein